MKKTITLTKTQSDFLISALEIAGHRIYEDPSAYGFEEEDYEDDKDDNYKRLEADIKKFKKEVCDDIIKQLE